MINSCRDCPVEAECHYVYKPCECVGQRKFWSEERRAEYDAERTPEKIEKGYNTILEEMRSAGITFQDTIRTYIKEDMEKLSDNQLTELYKVIRGMVSGVGQKIPTTPAWLVSKDMGDGSFEGVVFSNEEDADFALNSGDCGSQLAQHFFDIHVLDEEDEDEPKPTKRAIHI